jgi:hypothetical protein
MANIEVISERTEERPFYHEFTKNDIVGFCPTMANLDYDPFPNNKLDDVVRKEIISRELLWYAKLKGDVLPIRPGVVFERDGHRFAIIEAKINLTGRTSDVEGSEFLTPCEPIKVLERLRKFFAENRPQQPL